MAAIRCYNYAAVYAGGKELQLEQLRASLPGYKYDHGKPDEEVIHYQKNKVYPCTGGELQLEQVRAILAQYQPAVEMEMTRIATTVSTLNPAVVKSYSKSVEEELELLCAEKFPCAFPSGSKSSVAIEPDLNLLHDKENRCSEDWYALSPDDSNTKHPSSLGGDKISTKLNFTDSFASVQGPSDCGGKQFASGNKFSVNSELELQAKHLQNQQEFDNEFAMTEILQSRNHEASKPGDHRRPLQSLTSQYPLLAEQSSFSVTQDESSFIPYHDSIQENNASRARKPLQSLILPKSQDESSFVPYHDSTQGSVTSFARKRQDNSSFIPYHDSMQEASFKVCESTCDQSSFSVFHDSMQTSSSTRAPSTQQCAPYFAPLGVPLTHLDHSVSDQTFTQMDIAHPSQFKPESTPKTITQQRCTASELICDLSVIPPSDHYKSTGPLGRIGNLTPIKEEPSGSSKLSSSSSRFTASSTSSGSSSCNSACHSVSTSASDLNPFLPDIVNRMLNCLGGLPLGAVQEVPFPLPPISPGQCLQHGNHSLHILQELHKGKFSTLYLVANGESKQVFRMYSNALIEWEVTILNQLQFRLKKKNLQKMSDCYTKYDQIFHFQDVFVTMSNYHHQGSIQSVIERYSKLKRRVPEALVYYFALEMFSVVAHLHCCGLIHAALKPAHFLIRDIRGLDDPTGVGLCLTDLRHAVDTSQFAEDQLYVGMPPHSSGNLLEGQSWKWQLDYHGLVWCLLPLILTVQSDMGASGVVNKHPQTGLFYLSAKPFKAYNTEVWHGVIDKLLNAEILLLSELGEHFKEKTYSSDSIQEIAFLMSTL